MQAFQDICSDKYIRLKEPDIPDHLGQIARVQYRAGPFRDLRSPRLASLKAVPRSALSTLGDVVLWPPGEDRDS